MNNIKLALYFIGLGLGLGTSLVIYAHTTFATKTEMENMRVLMHRMDERIYDIHLKVVRDSGN